MANISGMNSAATDAVFIPQMYSKLVLAARHANLVAAKLFENRSSDGKLGSAVDFPIKSTMASVAWTIGKRLTDNLAAATETKKTITMDQEVVAPFHISKRLKTQELYDQVALSAKESMYAVEKTIDTYVLGKSSEFTNAAVGTAGVALTNIVCTAAVQSLDIVDAPATERFWLLDPRCKKDLFDLTGNYFTSMDFAGSKALVTGQQGDLLGSPVYFSTNLPTGTTGSPATTYRKNIYAHKQAIGVVMQREAEYEIEYDIDTQGWIGNTSALFGAAGLRVDHGVIVQGR